MTNFLQNCNIIWHFYFWRVLLVITKPPLNDYSTLSPYITYPLIHFRKIDMTTKNSGGFIRFPPLFRGGGCCHGLLMGKLFHDEVPYHTETSPLFGLQTFAYITSNMSIIIKYSVLVNSFRWRILEFYRIPMKLPS